MITKEAFTEKYNDVAEDIFKAMQEALTRALGNNAVELEKLPDNYTAVYPLIAAVLQRETTRILEGSGYESTRRAQKRQATSYRKDYRIWHEYAGDYRTDLDKRNRREGSGQSK